MPEVRIYKGETGRLYGIADWEEIRLYVTNFRKNDGGIICPLPKHFQKINDGVFADVSTPSASREYYNVRGQKRWPHRICGLLWYNNDIAYMTLKLGPEQKQEFFCAPIWKISETDNKTYISLTFNSKGI